MGEPALQPRSKQIPVAWQTQRYCPACHRVVVAWTHHGRWDEERQATAIPFDHVATTFEHYKEDLPNCVVGDIDASRPRKEATP